MRQLAIRNHRSMQEQVRLMIEREVRYTQEGAVERARQWRSVLAGRHFPELAADIQANRSRIEPPCVLRLGDGSHHCLPQVPGRDSQAGA